MVILSCPINGIHWFTHIHQSCCTDLLFDCPSANDITLQGMKKCTCSKPSQNKIQQNMNHIHYCISINAQCHQQGTESSLDHIYSHVIYPTSTHCLNQCWTPSNQLLETQFNYILSKFRYNFSKNHFSRYTAQHFDHFHPMAKELHQCTSYPAIFPPHRTLSNRPCHGELNSYLHAKLICLLFIGRPGYVLVYRTKILCIKCCLHFALCYNMETTIDSGHTD